MPHGGRVDKLVAFLARRDGGDRVVKTIQYICKLVHWYTRVAHPDFADRAKRWEVACSMSRKGFRLGRYVNGFNRLRRHPGPTPLLRALAVPANGGEMVYIFFDNLLWLARIGVVDSGFRAPLTFIAAFGEVVGYAFFIIIDLIMLEKEFCEERRLAREGGIAGEDKEEKKFTKAIRRIREDRLIRLLAIAANAADLVIAVSDVEPNRFCNHAVSLGISGLVSAWTGWYRQWHS